MSSLSPKGSALIQAARRALRATSADRERNESALRAQLGANALPFADAGPASAALPTPGVGQLLAKVVAGAGLVGGTLLASLALPTTTPHPPSAPPAVIQRTARDVHSEVQDDTNQPQREPEAAQAAAGSPSDRAPASPAARRPNALAQEVQLLSRATSDLKAGRPQDALRAIAAHQRRFPAGIMAQERRAAKAQALCLVGRLREGRAELTQLPSNSPAAAHARHVCDRAAREGSP
jgi:hypothetical protein